MNRCVLHRKEMALLASDHGDRHLPPTLREHIARCAPCRDYWKEINALCTLYTSAAEDPHASLPVHFHETWFNQVHQESLPPPAPLARFFPHFENWPLKAALVTFLLLIIAIPVLYRPESDLTLSPPVNTPVTGKPSALTLLDYRFATSDSALDALMHQEPTGTSRSKRTYTLLKRSEEEPFY